MINDSNSSLRSIQTRYGGCHFRSRLEARWAVFLDTLGVPWEYEPQGFEWDANPVPDELYGATLKGGRYLPDFWLPSIETWFEVKGAKPTDEEMRLCFELHLVTDQRVILSAGDIPRDPNVQGREEDDYDFDNMLLNGGMDHPYHWCVCPWCGKPGIEFDARGARVCGWKAHHSEESEAWADPNFDASRHWRIDDKCYSGDDDRLLAAYTAARSARFEHGQNGAR